MKDILSGQRQRLVYMPTYGQAKFVEVDLARKVGPVPAHIMLIIRREDSLVENLKWGFEPGRARPLQDHRSLLRVSSRDRPRTGTARDSEIDGFFSSGRCGQQSQAAHTCSAKQPPPRHLMA